MRPASRRWLKLGAAFTVLLIAAFGVGFSSRFFGFGLPRWVRTGWSDLRRAWSPYPRAPREGEPRALTGSLRLESSPPGARVSIDGRPVGTTPLSVHALPTGTHRVRFELRHHAPHEGDFDVRAGRTRRLVQPLLRLQPKPPTRFGRLTLTSTPRAEVYIDDRHLGRTPLHDYRLPAGILRLELRTEDGRRLERGVFVKADDTTSTHLSLVTRSSERPAPIERGR